MSEIGMNDDQTMKNIVCLLDVWGENVEALMSKAGIIKIKSIFGGKMNDSYSQLSVYVSLMMQKGIDDCNLLSGFLSSTNIFALGFLILGLMGEKSLHTSTGSNRDMHAISTDGCHMYANEKQIEFASLLTSCPIKEGSHNSKGTAVAC